ncbi:MAG: hypothetical protein A2W05_08000 [Candidatus Schekmanbacteria bacterium RBG_16_38_10]|uniref:Uncharacterized protein n=1 Tax=Candidatus Schekmanbacteria bacterium RBG_16_38_10 TaxID=1817879 RepID=A0A1F7RQJ3_9BACT|nr:MAG: hypothetical protein A2W05_08000 [Candidatus Schekmanbacteria bacterium RBG_16_38_10]
MYRAIKNLIGLILIPFVSCAVFSLYRVGEEFFKAGENGLYLLIGIITYIIIRFGISKLGSSVMEFAEVFYHELIHTVYSIICLKGIKSFFASDERGGEIETSKTNFVIDLSPYFFPIISVLISLIRPIVVKKYYEYLILCAGIGIGLHLSSVFHDLKVEQSDINKNGVLFSFVIIFLLTMIFLGIVFSLLNSGYTSILEFLDDFLKNCRYMLNFFTKKFID